MSYRTRGLIILSLIVSAMLAWFAWYRPAANPERLLLQARAELAKRTPDPSETRRSLERAEALARQVADSKSASASWGAIVAAEAAIKQGQHGRALEYYQRVPPGSDEAALSAQFGAAEMLAHAGRLSESEKMLRQLIELAPEYVLAHYRLAFILNITGRRCEAGNHLLFLVRADAAELDHLMFLGNTERVIEDRALLTESRQQSPDDPLPLLGLARLELTLSHPIEARRLLQRVKQELPHETEVQVRWGQLLLESGTRNEFLAWNAGLQSAVEAHPDVWLMRGLFWQKENEPRWAIRCFWESLRRDPEIRQSHYQLGQALARLHDPRADRFLKRSDQLLNLTLVLDDLFNARSQVGATRQSAAIVDSMRHAAELTEQLGRLWEARAWAMAAMKADSNADWALALLQRVNPRLAPSAPQTLPAENLALTTDLVEFPLPIWPAPQAGSASVSSPSLAADIRFRDDSGLLDGGFVYFQSPDSTTPGARIFETTGGGVGVLDFDNDHWPDLYFTQGCEVSQTASATPPGPATPGTDQNQTLDRGTEQFAGLSQGDRNEEYLDQLQRNLSGQRFRNVTAASHLGDARFSQGVSAGDFDNDGFQDLYVANIGRNRLYQNQGDGTFRDVTDQAAIAADWWTTSCLIADLNGDSFPDIYDVNYVGGDKFMTLLCEKQGLTRSCSPRAFAAAPDQIWLNLGDGRFRDATAESGINLPQGYGLGIIAANFANNGRLSLFVANDETANYFFVNHSPMEHHEAKDGQELGQAPLKFEELGLPSGLAVDENGASQACMGVAAGDADGDGLLDLFVTNFYRESNTLYRQAGPLQFLDETRAARLHDPSFEKLGFGTQFLDGDLDGRLDLIIANGHIDDMTDLGEPYQMPPQFFHNQGDGTFREQPAASLGKLFEKKYLGRGLARLDWNKDGRDDFCVSHIAAPAVLATNESMTAGNFIVLRLVGRDSSRDAIGARIEIRSGGQTLVRELVGGDGYQASNERVTTVGLGRSKVIESLTITWLDGTRQTWSNVTANQHLLIIEGADRLWICR